MATDDFEEFEEELTEQEIALARQAALEGEILDREMRLTLENDDFFKADFVGEDGVYVPPLDEFSPKMKEIWAPDDPDERTDQAVTLEGDYSRVVETPLMIEHDGEGNE